MIQEALKKTADRGNLTSDEMTSVMDEVMTGQATPAQIAGFIVALRMKGETVAEVSGAAASMRKHATYINAGVRTVVDTCGTGGDGAGTFNISTTTAFVTAGAGICVAKHGNRAVSSQCGSADVLLELGVNINAEPEVMEQCIQEHGIGFLFAPKMHPAMKHAIGPRRELGIRTIFNMLGPLTNPAGATGQVLGVFAPELTEMFAHVLKELGTRRAFIVHGHDGLDEITCTGPTRVSELRDGVVKTYELNPELLLPGGVADASEIAGGDAQKNAEILKAVLSGEQTDGARDVVLLNAAAAIVAGEKADGLEDGLKLAMASIDSGAAMKKLEMLVEASR